MASADRYHRQRIVPEIGEAGQRALRKSRVLVLGVGALGSVAADLLARAGVGHLRIVDRDVVELTNLQRQTLFAEGDVDRPKAEAAARRLAAVNSEIAIEPAARDFNARTYADLLRDVDFVVDGTDNMEARLLLNDACLKLDVPWVYGGAIATNGMVLPVRPEGGPCFRCMVPRAPAPGSLPTCDTAGILNTVSTAIASLQVTLAIRHLIGNPPPPKLYVFDAWEMDFQKLDLKRRKDCPACVSHRYEFLAATSREILASLCGRDAISLDPMHEGTVDLAAISERLKRIGTVRDAGSVVMFETEGVSLTVFPDGRALIRGTEDPDRAKALYAKYVGR
ncbi:MAG TPA: ThiF family adenylyltransferase [Thermoplasmata archaeon]|nr:ThiF family adenylyltransferase [Thermoplasmata archaeon]